MTAIRDALADARRRYAARMASATDRRAAGDAQRAYEDDVGAILAPALRDGASLGLPGACEDALAQARRTYLDGFQQPGAKRGCSAFDTYIESVARIVVQHGEAEARPAPRPVADVEQAERPRITIEVVGTTDDHQPDALGNAAHVQHLPPSWREVLGNAQHVAHLPAPAPAPTPAPAPADDGDIYDTYDRRLTEEWRQPPPTAPRRNGVQHDPVA
jgi:hypothetical protein